MRFILAILILVGLAVGRHYYKQSERDAAQTVEAGDVIEPWRLADLLEGAGSAIPSHRVVQGGGRCRDAVSGRPITGIVAEFGEHGGTDGRVRVIANVVDGRVHGPVVTYHASGGVRLIGNFDRGRAIAYVEFGDDGRVVRAAKSLSQRLLGRPLEHDEILAAMTR
ncbi:MAG: hypothetical protein AAFR38_01800 [Planctomycetota bacterium]